jgi:hypothetical protein
MARLLQARAAHGISRSTVGADRVPVHHEEGGGEVGSFQVVELVGGPYDGLNLSVAEGLLGGQNVLNVIDVDGCLRVSPVSGAHPYELETDVIDEEQRASYVAPSGGC